jgi:DHA1 family inner membrane transport protein
MKRPSERTLLLLLAAVQFTHITDFMVLMPLGPQLMRDLAVGPDKFSWLVSAYTWAAGLVGFAAASFMDRFDRRTLLLGTYAGFVVGTVACAMSHSHPALLAARALSGAFGGVSGAVVLAAVADLVPPERRATGMGIVMTAFAAAAALGVPFSLFIAQRFDWEAPFWVLAGISLVVWVAVWRVLPPLRGHLDGDRATGLRPLLELLGDANVLRALAFMASLVFAHFTIIPLLSPFLVANVGVPEDRLFLVYFVGGALTVFTAPALGRLADRRGRVAVFTALVAIASLVTLTISHSPRLPLWVTLTLGGAFFVFASGRFVPAQAIQSLAVLPQHRGAFMSLNACARDLASGATSAVGGWIVTKSPVTGELVHFNRLGWLAVACGLVSVWLARRVKNVESRHP